MKSSFFYRTKLLIAIMNRELSEEMGYAFTLQVMKAKDFNGVKEAVAKEMLNIVNTFDNEEEMLMALHDRIKVQFKRLEFEQAVREELDINDRDITEKDLFMIKCLDLSNFCFADEDVETLAKCVNLEELDINTGIEDFSVLKSLTMLKDLHVTYYPKSKTLDLSIFRYFKKLEYLGISGGDISNMDLTNSDSLVLLEKLKSLHFHEFGSVDLQFLEKMPQIEYFFCGWANEIQNIVCIGALKNLKFLDLSGESVEGLDFLENLPETMQLELCGINIEQGDFDISKFERFENRTIDEMRIKGKTIIC